MADVREVSGGAIPAEWRLVPVELTEAMYLAGCDQLARTPHEVWSAMLSAAPTPEVAGNEAFTDAEIAFIHGAMKWADHSVGEGFVDPEQLFIDYDTASDDHEWETLADRLAERLRAYTPKPTATGGGGVRDFTDREIIDFAARFKDDSDNGYRADTRRWIRALRAALATPAPGGGEVERLREALTASLAKRSHPTLDPIYSVAFNAALDMVARDTEFARAALRSQPAREDG